MVVQARGEIGARGVEIVELIGVCFVAPLAVALVLSGEWRSGRAWWLGLAATGALAATIVAVGVIPPLLPKSAFVDALQWNWTGKVAAIAATFAIYAVLPPAFKAEAGLFAVPRPPRWLPVVIGAAALIAFFWGMAWLARDPAAPLPGTETLLFQATMPGLDEEASFRGVILALLAGALGKPWRVAGIGIGWGALPVIAFFGLAHGFGAVAGGGGIDWTAVAVTGVTGAGLLWLKERTGSIWVPVVVHNILNVGAVLIG